MQIYKLMSFITEQQIHSAFYNLYNSFEKIAYVELTVSLFFDFIVCRRKKGNDEDYPANAQNKTPKALMKKEVPD